MKLRIHYRRPPTVVAMLLALVGVSDGACAPPSPAMRSSTQKLASSSAEGALTVTIGNLSVSLLFESWGSPMARLERKSAVVEQAMPQWLASGGDQSRIVRLRQQLEAAVGRGDFEAAERALDEILTTIGRETDSVTTGARSRERHEEELQDYLRAASEHEVQGIEDYLGWGVVEPVPDEWDWTTYRRNRDVIRRDNLDYVPYVWLQNLPRWVRGDNRYSFATCLEHGLPSESLSIFSERTRNAYDRLYGKLREELGSGIDALRIASPYGFGEIHYPAGAAQGPFPQTHLHPGFWVGESEARSDFRSSMARKYGSITALNRAWRSSHRDFADIDYPATVEPWRRWLDFVDWYHEALTRRMGDLVDVVRGHFPETPLVVSVGFPYEKINLGLDLSGIAKMAAAKGVILRGPTGPQVPFLYTKHLATAVHHYAPPGFSSEPVNGEAQREEIALALFKDLTTGVSWHFDYASNLRRAGDLFRDYGARGRLPYPSIDTALFFPTSSHRIDNWNSWQGEGMAGGYPGDLRAFAEQIRDILDYDVIDERMVRDGFLERYQLLIWPFGSIAEADVLDSMLGWIEDGGTLLVSDLSAIRDVDGGPPELAAQAASSANAAAVPLGAGYLLDMGGNFGNLPRLVVQRDDLRKIRSDYPARLAGSPPDDRAADGVLTSRYEDGWLFFNRTGAPVTVDLSHMARSSSGALLPRNLLVPPLSVRRLDAATGSIR